MEGCKKCAGIEMGEGLLNDMYRLDAKSRHWSELEPSGASPEARSFHAMVAVGSSLYVFGGCGKSGRLNDLHRFDTEALEWQHMPSSSDIKVGHGVCCKSQLNSWSWKFMWHICCMNGALHANLFEQRVQREC